MCIRDSLLTMLSMIGVAAERAATASSDLPALTASVALRMALRSCEVNASFRARCTVDCRAAFSADLVFATLVTFLKTRARSLRNAGGLVKPGYTLRLWP